MTDSTIADSSVISQDLLYISRYDPTVNRALTNFLNTGTVNEYPRHLELLIIELIRQLNINNDLLNKRIHEETFFKIMPGVLPNWYECT